MRHARNEQDDAHWLLCRWAQGVEAALGSEYPPAPMSPTVQGDVSEYTRPELYSNYSADHEALDRAVRRLDDIDPRLKGVLWQQYVSGSTDAAGRPDEQRMADEMGWTVKHWREWRDIARLTFLNEIPQGVLDGLLGRKRRVDAEAGLVDNRA